MSQSNAPVSMKTICEHCIFAEYDGLVQIGCEFNRIEKFAKDSKVNLVDNGTKKYYEIENRHCNYCTLPSTYEDLDFKTAKNKVIETNKVHFTLIIKENLETMKDVQYYLKHNLPVTIHIISSSNNFKKEYNHSSVIYHIMGQELDDNQLVKMVAIKDREGFYLVRAHGAARKSFNRAAIQEIEDSVNDKLERPLYIKGSNYWVAHKRGLLSFDGNIRKFKKAVTTS